MYLTNHTYIIIICGTTNIEKMKRNRKRGFSSEIGGATELLIIFPNSGGEGTELFFKIMIADLTVISFKKCIYINDDDLPLIHASLMPPYLELFSAPQTRSRI